MTTEAQKSPVDQPNDAKSKPEGSDTRSSQSMAQEVDRTREAVRSLDQLADPSPAGTSNSPRSMSEFAENSIQAHLNPQDNVFTLSRVADATFGRTNLGSSGFEARAYAIQATMADGRPVVDAVSLSAGGANYDGWRAVNPESGREYFYSNQGQRFEMVKDDTSYTALKPVGADARDGQPIAITEEPRPSGSLSTTGDRATTARAADSDVQLRPPSLPSPEVRGTAQPPRAEQALDIRPELLVAVRRQIADSPELLSQLQRSNDPRAAALLDQLGHKLEVSARDSPSGQPTSTAHGDHPPPPAFSAGRVASDAFFHPRRSNESHGSWLQMLHTNEQLVGLLRGNFQLNNPLKALDANSTRANLLELNNVLKAFNGMQNVGQTPLDFLHLLLRSPDGTTGGLKEFFPGRAPDQAALREAIDRLTGRREEHTGERQFVRGERARAQRVEAQENLTLSDIARTLKEQQEKELTKKDPLASKQQEEDARRRAEEEQQRLGKAEEEGRHGIQAAEAALLAAMSTKKPAPETKDDEKAVDATKKDDEKRLKYIVKQGDTLESIAFKMLRDKRLAGLIYDINKTVIPVKRVNGRNVIELKTGLTLWLPTSKDIKDYRVRLMTSSSLDSPPATAPVASGALPAPPEEDFASAEEELRSRFGENWAGSKSAAEHVAQPDEPDEPNEPLLGVAPNAVPVPATGSAGVEDVSAMDASARAAFEARRANVEQMLGPLVPNKEQSTPHYMVRLGDTLKSIAMKHPALADIKLWRLLARVNGISAEVDARGNPLARVKRGQALTLPMQDEIDAFRAAVPPMEPVRDTQSAARIAARQPADNPLADKPEAPATPEQNSDAVNAVAAQVSLDSPQPTLSAPKQRTVGGESPGQLDQPARSPRRTNQRLKALAQHNAESAFVVLTERDGNSRLVQSGSVEKISAGLRLKLEADNGSGWLPVLVYEIYDDVSLRHEYKPDGTRKTIRIDLPPAAAVELANNDLQSNWHTYCAKFLS